MAKKPPKDDKPGKDTPPGQERKENGGHVRKEVSCTFCQASVLVINVQDKDDLAEERKAIKAAGWVVNPKDQTACTDCKQKAGV